VIGYLIEILFYQPTFNLLMIFYNLFGGDLGWAILIIALIAKIITIPITNKQLKAAEEMKVFQQKSTEVRKKYEKNPNKMNDELMKLSSKYMPAQLAGCLPLIITIILLIQVRGVVVNLVNQGYHAFNKVAYVESLKVTEDSVLLDVEDLDEENVLRVQAIASNGKEIEKEFKFFVVDDEKRGKERIKEENKRVKDLPDDEKEEIASTEARWRESDISVYVENFEKGNFMTKDKGTLEVYLRAPSKEQIREVNVFLNDEDLSEVAEVQTGAPMNINFWGINLSKVGRDYLGEWDQFTPYLALSVILGISQFGITKIQMSNQPLPEKKKDKDKKKKSKDEPESMDFSEAMQQSSRQMMFLMPLMTVAISLGYLGGANLFPAGVSLFWTAQNAFVIIQLGITKRDKIKEWVVQKYSAIISKNELKQ
jgi:YidC/Oxa1 family membrane protein insertase